MIRVPATPSQRLIDDERGVTSMIFAISLTAMMMGLGCAIDVGRALHASQKVTMAIDSAAIAAAKSLKDAATNDTDVELLADRYFQENFKGPGTKGVSTRNFRVRIDHAKSEVEVSLDTDVATSFARVAGIEKMTFARSSIAVFNPTDIEVGLQLDLTGSMTQTIGGIRKIDSLKVATQDLVNILLPSSGTGSNKVRIGMAPFAAAVNAGSYALAVSGNRASNGCVYERMSSAEAATDAVPVGSDSLRARSDVSASAQSCPGAAGIVPLTTDRSALLNYAANLQATNNSTAGHLGTAWAWYLISPKWTSIWPTAAAPAAYGDTKTKKIAILMTDGIYNTVGGISHNDYGAEAPVSKQMARDLCQGMRDQNIVIYSVGFIKAGDDPAAADTLKACAGSDSYFYEARNGDELRAAFQAIAKDISKLRLSH